MLQFQLAFSVLIPFICILLQSPGISEGFYLQHRKDQLKIQPQVYGTVNRDGYENLQDEQRRPNFKAARRPPRREPTVMKVLPADESLLHNSSSEGVEELLGHVRLGRQYGLRRRRRHKHTLRSTTNAVKEKKTKKISKSKVSPSSSKVSKSKVSPSRSKATVSTRVHALQDIFSILDRQNGSLFEQLLSFQDTTNQLVKKLVKKGISKIPPLQRDAVIKQVLRQHHLLRP